jgi:hypothetical protein
MRRRSAAVPNPDGPGLLVQIDGQTFTLSRDDATDLLDRVAHALDVLDGHAEQDPSDWPIIAIGKRAERPRFSGAVRWVSPMPEPVVTVEEIAP